MRWCALGERGQADFDVLEREDPPTSETAAPKSVVSWNSNGFIGGTTGASAFATAGRAKRCCGNVAAPVGESLMPGSAVA